MTTRAERVAELLAGVPPVERFRGMTVEEAAPILGVSAPTVYRLHAEGKLGGVKGDGAERKGGRGRSGTLRIRLLDIVEFQVAHEVGAVVAPMPVSSRRAGKAG